ncbi:MAG TPA: T9SS type A sorting domain-containing protein [Spirochaetota bacterium]|nr:T9SS type A sorting domain-containing protein [Spirochaetota bacterium]
MIALYEEQTGLIDNYKVYPNPFDPSLAGDITFFFTALENGKATLQIFSIDGHLVYACTEQITVTANNQRVYLNWDARSKNSRYTAATGAYLARLVYTPANDKSSSVERIEKFIIYKQDN